MKPWLIDTIGVLGWAALTGGVYLQFSSGIALMVGGGLLLAYAIAAGRKGARHAV